MSAPLRSPGRPLRVAELLLPTVLTIAGRGPVSAENFLTWLKSAGESPEPVSPPAAGTRVTNATKSRPALEWYVPLPRKLSGRDCGRIGDVRHRTAVSSDPGRTPVEAVNP